MLNQHEVKVHNMRVALNEVNRKVDAIANAWKDAERRAKQLDKKIKAGKQLPIMDPNARPPRKIYMGGKSVALRSQGKAIATPKPLDLNRQRQVNSANNWVK